MPQVLTSNDIVRYKKMIEQKGKTGVDQFYTALRKKGYPPGIGWPANTIQTATAASSLSTIWKSTPGRRSMRKPATACTVRLRNTP